MELLWKVEKNRQQNPQLLDFFDILPSVVQLSIGQRQMVFDPLAYRLGQIDTDQLAPRAKVCKCFHQQKEQQQQTVVAS
ncbi:hypothetical protein GPALN_001880 [Globodera pallida]|uniref:Uncharacterized protein n=1 Tax=Globodera pallida TaxID=36090 RepID=A0A183BS15_GLOPA|nr:hypothetical protein GPALN_001880 [Globodera pallida]